MRVVGDVPEGLFERVSEAKGNLRSGFLQVARDRFIHIPLGSRPQDYGFRRHSVVCWRIRARSVSK